MKWLYGHKKLLRQAINFKNNLSWLSIFPRNNKSRLLLIKKLKSFSLDSLLFTISRIALSHSPKKLLWPIKHPI